MTDTNGDARPEAATLAYTTDHRLARIAFPAFIIACLLAKLFVASAIAVNPIWAPADYTNFLDHARSILEGRWFGPFNDLTLVKGPFFPLFIAAAATLAIPLPLAIQLLYFLASLAIVAALRPVLRKSDLQMATFAVVFFDPYTFSLQSANINRGRISPSLTLFLFAASIALLLARKGTRTSQILLAVALGLAFSAFALNREEWLWAMPALVIMAIAYVALDATSLTERAFRGLCCAVPFAIFATATYIVAETNERFYGWHAVNEIQSAEYIGAYASLVRLKTESTQPLVPVTDNARRKGYAISPALRELQPYLDGAIGQSWQSSSCQHFHVCDGIAAGWFGFALRDSVGAAGHYHSGREARAYYVRLMREIDSACEAKRIACAQKRLAIVPAPTASDIARVAARAIDGLTTVFTYRDIDLAESPGVEVSTISPESALDYGVVHAQTINVPNRTRIQGWLFARRGSASIDVRDRRDRSIPYTLTYFDSPDLAAVFAKTVTDRSALSHARFEIRARCTGGCYLVIRSNGTSSRPIDVASTTSLDAKIWLLNIEARDEIDLRDTPLIGFKKNLENEIATVYRVLMPIGTVLALAAFIVIALRLRFRMASDDRVIAISLLAISVSVISLVYGLALLDVMIAPGLDAEYVAPIYPLASLVVFGSILLCLKLIATNKRAEPKASESR